MTSLEWLWPTLAKDDTEAGQRAARRRLDLDAIQQRSWANDTDSALEEARRLTDAEAERRKTADGKAATYLTVVSALVPILSSAAPSLWDAKQSVAQSWVTVVPMAAAITYLVFAGVWAFRTLRVAGSARVDTADLVEIWDDPSPKARLVVELLQAVRHNHDGVNEKVTKIKMTDAFLLRAFIAFAAVLLVQVTWKPAASLVNVVSKSAASGAQPGQTSATTSGSAKALPRKPSEHPPDTARPGTPRPDCPAPTV